MPLERERRSLAAADINKLYDTCVQAQNTVSDVLESIIVIRLALMADTGLGKEDIEAVLHVTGRVEAETRVALGFAKAATELSGGPFYV